MHGEDIGAAVPISQCDGSVATAWPAGTEVAAEEADAVWTPEPCEGACAVDMPAGVGTGLTSKRIGPDSSWRRTARRSTTASRMPW